MKRALYLITIFAVLVGLFASVTPAQAGTSNPPWPMFDKTVLEKMYQSALTMLPKQAASIEKAKTTEVTNAQTYIDKKKAEGKDTVAMEAALAAFVAKLPEIQALHDKAAAILATHAGFDADGKVIDLEKAIETAFEANGYIMEASGMLTEARFNLAKVIGDWKKIEASLPRDYRTLKLASKLQQKKLDAQPKIVARTQTYINKMKAAGKDTTELDAALVEFQASIAAAQVKHDEAAAILATHAGFDDSGKVIDQAAAKTTVDTAKAAILESNKILGDAYNKLMTVMAAWKKAHR